MLVELVVALVVVVVMIGMVVIAVHFINNYK